MEVGSGQIDGRMGWAGWRRMKREMEMIDGGGDDDDDDGVESGG